MKHTKGNWTVEGSQINSYAENGKLTNVGGVNEMMHKSVSDDLREEAEANIKLMASAPKLFEALSDIVLAHNNKIGRSAVQLRVNIAADLLDDLQRELS